MYTEIQKRGAHSPLRFALNLQRFSPCPSQLRAAHTVLRQGPCCTPCRNESVWDENKTPTAGTLWIYTQVQLSFQRWHRVS